MYIYIIIPCLNEASSLYNTAVSLGFDAPREAATDQTFLVLLDNGSTDKTSDIIAKIKRGSQPDCVLSAVEMRKGYVFARCAGIDLAEKHIAKHNLPASECFIIQADADTLYKPGYIQQMALAAKRNGTGFLYEGYSERPSQQEYLLQDYFALEEQVDTCIDLFNLDESYDVVVDDKVCAFYLSDYHAWGGHQREFTHTGEEIYAETTRLFIKARLRGAKKLKIEAFAETSVRKILENPALAFATAGYPVSPEWKERWLSIYSGSNDLSDFHKDGNARLIQQAVDMRRQFLDALFKSLPNLMLANVKSPFKETIRHPGRLLEQVIPTVQQTLPQ